MNKNWRTNKPNCLPDFIIGGAMKSGTTTLHRLLEQHPDVFMAKDELGFFDMDNIVEHPDFNYFDKDKGWFTQNIHQSPETAWKWYFDKFKEGQDRLIGEDSTTYLASPVAARRIGMQHKPIKMIFILRHPTARTISNYYHLLKSGRAEYDLEETLQYNPYSIIRRSLYYDQLKHFYTCLRPDNIKVVLFEDLIKDTDHFMLEICQFLAIDFDKYNKEDPKVHANKTLYPRSEKIQLIHNRINRSAGKSRYAYFPPFKYAYNHRTGIKEKIFKKVHKKINPKHASFKPQVNPQTKKYLDEFFMDNLKGIDELTGKNIMENWFYH